MKRILALVVFLLCFRFVSIAQKNRSPILLLDTVPLIVKTDLFIDSTYPDRSFVFVSPKLEINLAQRVDTIKINGVFRIATRTITKDALKDLEYVIAPDGSAGVVKWKPLPMSGRLVDTVMPAGTMIKIKFRNRRTGKLIQATKFYRFALLPKMVAYRQEDVSDTTGLTLASRKAFTSPAILPGYIRIRDDLGDSLLLLPGRKIAFQVLTENLNLDSSIRFRLWNAFNDPDTTWKTTGHLVSLSKLASGENYTLELKYAGGDRARIYRIAVSRYWWDGEWIIFSFVMTGTAILILSSCLIVRRVKFIRARKREMLRNKIAAAQHKLSPHFIRNAITTIGSLVTDHQTDEANTYLVALSEMMHGVLVNSDRIYIRLSEEITALDQYLKLEQLRFGFTYAFEVDPSLNLSETEIPPMLLQPSIENAIKHGVSSIKSEGLIRILFKRQGNNLLVFIEDNGTRGLGTDRAKPGHGNGIRLTRERISNLENLLEGVEIDFEIKHFSLGTTVRFRFMDWLD